VFDISIGLPRCCGTVRTAVKPVQILTMNIVRPSIASGQHESWKCNVVEGREFGTVIAFCYSVHHWYFWRIPDNRATTIDCSMRWDCAAIFIINIREFTDSIWNILQEKIEPCKQISVIFPNYKLKIFVKIKEGIRMRSAVMKDKLGW